MTIGDSVSSDYTIDAGILAGGRGQRMGGQDKGLALLDEKPLARHVYDALSPHVQSVWINCNRNEDLYRAISSQLCTDDKRDFSGPLAGLASILSASKADFIITSPCDTPFIGNEYCLSMKSALERELQKHHGVEKPIVLVARCSEKVHPLHLCLSRQAIRSLRTSLKNSERKVFAWLQSVNPVYVDFSDHYAEFRNLNRPEDLTS